MDEYKVHANDLLAAFRVIPQPGVPPEESDALGLGLLNAGFGLLARQVLLSISLECSPNGL